MMASISDAVQNRNCRILQLLVAIPGTFCQRDAELSLLLATRNGYADCVKVFLDSRMSPDTKEQSAKTLLMIAAEYGHVEVIHVLIQAKSEVDMRYRSGETALHFAARCGQDECVAVLVAGGADVDALDREGNTPLLLAAQNSRHAHKAIKQLVKSGCKVDVRDRHLCTALHYTSLKAIGTELLLAAGAHPDVQDIDGNAPIHVAAIEGFDPVVRCLLTYHCNPNLLNKYRKMAVHYLAMKGHGVAIQDIAEAGGDLNHPDSDGKIPLWYAVSHLRAQAVLVLLTANCCPDAPATEAGNSETQLGSPLQVALEKRLYDVAKQLLLAGCGLAPLRLALASYAQRQKAMAEQVEQRPTLFSDEETAEADDKEAAAMKWFEEWVRRPHTLRQICRVSILRYLRLKIYHKDLLLGLPEALRDYVMLRELGELNEEEYDD